MFYFLMLLVFLIALLCIVIVLIHRRKGTLARGVPETHTSCHKGKSVMSHKVRPHLSPEASKVLDDAMDAEDDRFIGSKSWND